MSSRSRAPKGKFPTVCPAAIVAALMGSPHETEFNARLDRAGAITRVFAPLHSDQ
jgi:hypothetical protein